MIEKLFSPIVLEISKRYGITIALHHSECTSEPEISIIFIMNTICIKIDKMKKKSLI